MSATPLSRPRSRPPWSWTGQHLRRRSVLTGGLALAGALVGCGTPPAPGPTPTDPAVPTADGFPRQVQTALGPVDIPRRPTRVVTLGREAEVALALGVRPVGMPRNPYAGDTGGIEPYLVARAGPGVTVLNTAGGIPLEQVAALRPDVILAGTYYQVAQERDRLAQIAPVVTFRRGSFEDTWQEQAALIGEALGEPARAADVVTGLEARIADIAATHPNWRDRTFSMSFNYEAGKITTIADPTDFAIRLLDELGLRLSPTVERLRSADGPEQPDLGYETVARLEADVMLLAHVSPNVAQQLESLPVFTNLDAVRAGNYVPVDLITVSVLRAPMVLGIEYALDQLVPQLERALG